MKINKSMQKSANFRYTKSMQCKFFGLLLVGLAVSVPIAAHASFELVMVADKGTKSIHRFDGSSGVYLGSFGGGFLSNVESFVINQEEGLAYVGDENLGRIRVFNYNTGVLVRDLTLNVNGFLQSLGIAANGNLYNGYSSPSQIFSPTGAALGGSFLFNVAGNTGVAMASASHRSGRQFVASYDANLGPNSALQISPGPSPMVVKSAEVSNMGNYVVPTQLAIQNDRGIWLSSNGTARTFSTNAAGSTVTFNSFSTMNSLLAGSTFGVGFGHGDALYVSGRNSGNTSGVIMRTIYGSNANLSTFGAGILQNPGMVQVVVAPEPGTMLAIGAGLAFLSRRRKKAA